MVFPPEVIKGFDAWLQFFRDLWWGEVPLRMHQRAIGADSGTPEWHPEFARWMFNDPPEREMYREPNDQRLRTTRAFRKLRRKAPREFDVLYLMVARRPPLGLQAVANLLNERAIRQGKQERYDKEAVLILAVSGLDKCLRWW